MHFKNSFTAFYIRLVNRNLPVETARTKQGCIQYIWAVGSSQNNNTSISSKSIHFNKQLIQGALPFIITHHYILSSCTANSIYLINEYNTGTFFPCLFEQISYTTGANAYKHFDKVRTT